MAYLLPTHHRWQEALRMLAVALGVFGLSALVVKFTSTPQVAVLWPTNGLVLGICLMVNDRAARQTLFAAFLGNLASSIWLQTDFRLGAGLALANVMEMAFAWWALRTIVRQHPNLGHPEVLWRFTVFAVLLAPVLSGTFAGLLVTTFEPMPEQDYWQVFLSWWASDALGMALFAPLAVTFRPTEWGAFLTRDRIAPMLIPFVVLVGVTLAVFSQDKFPLLFFISPPLIWLVFRWGFPGATIGGLAVLLIAFPLTLSGTGPLMLMPNPDLPHRFFLLQVFMGTTLLSALPVGMILDHRNRLLARLRKRESELQYMAMHDPLSGLLNRRGLMDGLAAEFERSHAFKTPLSVVILDIDHFKAYNDTYGHPAGDDCLTWLAGELEAASSPVGGICGRQGGEEFAVVLPGLNLEEGVAWAELLRKRIENARRPHEGSPVGFLTVSVGVASHHQMASHGPSDLSRLLKTADRALYLAKESGRNRVLVVPSEPKAH